MCILRAFPPYEFDFDQELFLPMIGIALLVMFALFWLRPHLPSFLQSSAGCCPRCRYNLQANPDSSCPECGWGHGEATEMK